MQPEVQLDQVTTDFITTAAFSGVTSAVKAGKEA